MLKNNCNIQLNNFNGPLDLLLSLVKNNKINILEVDLLSLINQYIDFIDKNIENDLNELSSYLVISSYFLEIKSRLLIPKEVIEYNEEDDYIDEYELKKRILEYKQFKDASYYFENRKEVTDKLFSKQISKLENKEQAIKYEFDLNLLIKAFKKISDNFNNNKSKYIKVENNIFSLEKVEKIILDSLLNNFNKKTSLTELVNIIGINIQYLILVFLALLTLSKNNKVSLLQNNLNIFVELISGE